MLSLDYEKLYLLYDVSGVYKKSFKTFGKAVNAINDFSRDVVVYYSAEGDVK
jgi:predicted deacetylase